MEPSPNSDAGANGSEGTSANSTQTAIFTDAHSLPMDGEVVEHVVPAVADADVVVEAADEDDVEDEDEIDPGTLEARLQEIVELTVRVDPEETPFKSQYEARLILMQLHKKYTKRLDVADKAGKSHRDPEVVTDREMLGRIQHFLGVNHVATDEFANGEDFCMRSVENLKPSGLKFPIHMLGSLNQLGLVWSMRGSNKKAYMWLRQAYQLYNRCLKKRNLDHKTGDKDKDTDHTDTTDTDHQDTDTTRATTKGETVQDEVEAEKTDNVGTEGEDKKRHTNVENTSSGEPTETRVKERFVDSAEEWEQVEHRHTKTLYFLAQVFGAMGKKAESAKFCHLTLQRQLKDPDCFLKRDWGTNAVGLANYYMETGRLDQAYHCLEAAQSMLPPNALPIPEGAADSEEGEQKELGADMAKAWASFYLEWLRNCQRILLAKLMGEEAVIAPEPAPMLFVELGIPPAKPCVLSDDPILIEEIYAKGLHWFGEALRYFVLNGFVSDHIAICQELSGLHKTRASFEDDLPKQCALHRIRISLLRPLAEAISQKVYLELFQQLSDELASTLMEIMELEHEVNQKRAPGKDKINAQVRINQLCLQSVQWYSIWLHSFHRLAPKEDKKSKALVDKGVTPGDRIQPPDKLQEEYRPAYTKAVFAVARLYGKVYHTDPQVLVQFLRKSEEGFKLFLELCDEWSITTLSDELSIATELKDLLPIKIGRILATGLTFQE